MNLAYMRIVNTQGQKGENERIEKSLLKDSGCESVECITLCQYIPVMYCICSGAA